MRREVAEETGVVADPVRLTGVYKNIKLGVVALVFRARHVSGEPRPTEESAEVDWWAPETVVATMSEAFAVRVLDALRTGEPPVRLHDGVSLLPEAAERSSDA